MNHTLPQAGGPGSLHANTVDRYVRIPPTASRSVRPAEKTWYRWGVDPLTHTLVGASLAETGLKHKTAGATLTLIIAANLPDIDGVCMLAGHDAGLAGRRGITHGVIAWFVLPVLLALAMHALCKRAERKRAPPTSAAPVPAASLSFRWLLLLAAIGVLSHPLLDWMNSYGVRLLMPFSSTWFYGDALFIIDPVLWLLAAAAVVFAHSKTKLTGALWLALLLAATAIIIVPKLAPPPAKMLWCIGAGLLVFLRIRRGNPPSALITARVCICAIALYVGAMLLGTSNAHKQATVWLSQHALVADQLVVSPLAARPLRREVIARVGDTYHFLEVPAFGNEAPAATAPPMPVGKKTDAVIAALAAPQIQGAVRWMRLPAYEEAPTSEGVVVTIMDVRYSRMRGSTLGRTQVWLDNKLNVIQVRP